MKHAHPIDHSDIKKARAVLVDCPRCGVSGPRRLLREHLMVDHGWPPSLAYRAEVAA